MKVIVSHPTGNNFCRALVSRLLRENMLAEFHTSLGVFPGSVAYRLGSVSLFAEIRRRSFEPALKDCTYSSPWREIGRMISSKAGINYFYEDEKAVFSVDSVYKSLDRKVAGRLKQAAKKGVKAVYAYEDGALETFKEAKKLGLKTIYDLPIAYWETGRKLMMEEAIRLPEWQATLRGGISDSEAKLVRKTEELELADCIVVPGSFVLDSLPDWARRKQLIVAPFGTPSLKEDIAEIGSDTTTRPLRILFAGSMGQRKGLGDLFEAIKLLGRDDFELVVMGAPQVSMEFYKRMLPHFTYEAGRPNNEVLALMRSCDVFCLPSIVEGRALVMQEAMSQGLPLIITPNTGGADLVIEGETGFLVPIRSPESIAEKLNWYLEHRDEIPRMSKSAQLHAKNYSWENYENAILKALYE